MNYSLLHSLNGQMSLCKREEIYKNIFPFSVYLIPLLFIPTNALLTHGIQIVCIAWCVKEMMKSKNKHPLPINNRNGIS